MADEIKFGSPQTRGNGAVADAPVDEKAELKRKQRKSIEDEFNQDDPVGDAVRSLWAKVRG